MVSRRLQHFKTTCAGGINQQAELIQPNQCADALNVWAPDGRVKTRPGYRGVTVCAPRIFSELSLDSALKESPVGTYTTLTTVTLDSLSVGHRWYVGLATSPTTINTILCGIWADDVTATNSSATNFKT